MSSEQSSESIGAVQALEGSEEIIIGAAHGDVSLAVKFPREASPSAGELTERVGDATKELEHYAEVRGYLLGELDDDQDDVEEAEIATDGGVDVGGKVERSWSDSTSLSPPSVLTAVFALSPRDRRRQASQS